MGLFDYFYELAVEFAYLFGNSPYGKDQSYDFVIIGAALLAAGIVLRLFWVLTAPDNKKL